MTRADILNKAIEIVTQRQQVYGEPEDSFTIIALYWSAYLQSLGVIGVVPPGRPGFRKTGMSLLQSHDVAAMMILLKVARSGPSPEHTDNWMDIAGFAACAGEITTKNAT